MVPRLPCRPHCSSRRDCQRWSPAVGVAQLIRVAAKGHSDPVAAECRVDDEQVAAGVGVGEAEAVVLRQHAVDHRVTREALADIETAVAAPRGLGIVNLAVPGIVRVDAVRLVADGGEVGSAEAVDSREEDAVGRVVLHGEVLDDDARGAEHSDAVRQLELAVENDAVAVETRIVRSFVVTSTAPQRSFPADIRRLGPPRRQLWRAYRVWDRERCKSGETRQAQPSGPGGTQ